MKQWAKDTAQGLGIFFALTFILSTALYTATLIARGVSC